MMIPEKVNVCGIEYDVIEKEFIDIDSNRNYQGVCRKHGKSKYSAMN